MKRIFLSTIIISLLSGCFNQEVNVDSACEADKQFCTTLMEDVRCGKYRDDLIVGRHNYLTNSSPENLFKSLRVIDSYQECSHLAQLHQVRVINNKEKALKVNDLEARFIKAQKSELLRLKQQYTARLKNNDFIEQLNEAFLEGIDKKEGELFYLIDFLENQNLSGLKKLEELEQVNRLNDYRSYYYLAQEKARHNVDVLPLLLKGISLYPKELYVPVKKGVRSESLDVDTQLHFSFLREIVTLHYKHKRYDKAYIFASLLKFNNDSLSNIDMIETKIAESDRNNLQNVAEILHSRLEEGTFSVKS